MGLVRRLFGGLVISLFVLQLAADPLSAQSKFVVNSTGDAPDFSVGDGFCSTSAPNGADECTLRAAIEEANEPESADTVRFNIGGCPGGICTIAPDSALPVIVDTLWLDARTQPGTDCSNKALKIVLDGVNAGPSASGLHFYYPSGNGFVGGFVIHRFGANGIFMNQANNNHVACNVVGTDVTGTSDLGNGETGIYSYFSVANIIGTDGDGTNDAAEGNLVSGNNQWGIRAYGASNTRVSGNLIGSNLDVTATIPNQNGGVWMQCSSGMVTGTDFDLVSDAFEPNVIVGGQYGVQVYCTSETEENYVIGGNYIGTNPAQTVPLGTVSAGVRILPAGTVDGATTDGVVKRNVIANNGGPGIAHFTTKVGAVDHTFTENYIFNNGGIGIDLGPPGVSPNDPGDDDVGANNFQNSPVFTLALLNGVGFDIDYFVDSDPANSAFPITVEIFLADDDNEEGRFLIGSDTLTAVDQTSCGASPCIKEISWPPICSAGDILVATATDANGNTSEFSQPIRVVGSSFSVDARALLEGPYLGPDMSTSLNSSEYLPYFQPFSDPAYDGTSVDFDSVQTFVGAAAIVDWVLVSLRTGTTAATEVPFSKHAALIDEGGKITSVGADSLRFPGVVAGSYYLVLESRNHLGVMSSSPLPSINASWNFSTASSQAYGANPMKSLGAVWGLFSGDGNADGQTTAPDFNLWNAATTAGATGYLPSDYNFDGQVTAPDFNIWNANTTAGATSKVPD